MEHLGISQNQTHWLNLFGSVYKLELPRENIESVEQWEQHKKSEVFKSFLAFVLDDLKYKVNGLHVSLVRRSEQTRYLEPLITTEYKRIDSTAISNVNSDEFSDVRPFRPVNAPKRSDSNLDLNSGVVTVQPYINTENYPTDYNSNEMSLVKADLETVQTNPSDSFIKKMSLNEFDNPDDNDDDNALLKLDKKI